MKITVKHWLTRVQFASGMEPEFKLFPFDMQGSGDQYITVREQDVELDIPDDFDARPQMIAALEEKRRKAMADHEAFMNVIEGRIASLRAIEHVPEVCHD